MEAAKISLNLAVTDGESAVVSRFATNTQSPPRGLYLAGGERYECKEGHGGGIGGWHYNPQLRAA